MAPEVAEVSDDAGYSAYKADVFSFGCLIYFLCTGNEDWKDKTLRKMTIDNNLHLI